MYYESLIKYLSPYFDELGITENGDGSFTGKNSTFRVTYNQATKCYNLILIDGEAENVIGAYLFDETQTEKDTESVAMDFADTLRKKLGVAKKRNAQAIELPSDEGGENVSLSGLTQKLLAFFPQHKETYKLHCSEYGRFLTVDFYKEYLIPSVKALLASGNKKQIKKFYDAMTDIYVHGDNETMPFTVAVVSAAVYDNPELKGNATEATKADCATFAQNISNFCDKIKSSKKLRNALVKK
ncbi:MAG: hypothetical protein IJ946_04790 [Clostridia bacterium]|nr:hypothetical protein [Clostridia bacterium]